MREGKNMGIMTTFKKPTLERWGCRGVWVGIARIGTGVAGRLGGEARKGCGLTLALWQ